MKISRIVFKGFVNLTIIDDLRADNILNDYKPRASMTKDEIEIMSKY